MTFFTPLLGNYPSYYFCRNHNIKWVQFDIMISTGELAEIELLFQLNLFFPNRSRIEVGPIQFYVRNTQSFSVFSKMNVSSHSLEDSLVGEGEGISRVELEALKRVFLFIDKKCDGKLDSTEIMSTIEQVKTTKFTC